MVDYANILGKTIEKDKDEKDNQIVSRYSGLIHAIEFFSQRFDIEQIIEYAFDFTNNLLIADNVVLMCRDKNYYSVAYSKGYDHNDYAFEYAYDYDKIIHFHAGLLYQEHLEKFFPKTLSKKFKTDFAIPLIMDKSLFGIILVGNNKAKKLPVEDIIIAEALMNLFTTALTNYKGYKNLEVIKTKLDEKVFNLFAINQSTKALLSELSLHNLYELAISVFAELTQSSFTTFFLKDKKSENYKLMISRNIYDFSNNDMQATLFPNKEMIKGLPVLIDTENKEDISLFESYFFNGKEVIEKIKPKYIVIIKKDNALVGFVTLGNKVNGKVYESAVFELIESLASATYIAINNAIYIEEIKRQKDIINNKFNQLIKLNHLMKNINSAKTVTNVITLVMKTLEINFGIKMGFFGLYNDKDSSIQISGRINMSSTISEISFKDEFSVLQSGHTLIIYEEEEVKEIFKDDLLDDFQRDLSGAILLPVYIDAIDIKLIGIIGIFAIDSEVLMSEENIVKFEAITNHIAPVIYQLQYVENTKREYTYDNTPIIFESLSTQMKEAEMFRLELYIAHINHREILLFEPMEITNQLMDQYKYVYLLNKENIIIILNSKEECEQIRSLITDEYMMKIYTYKKDFTTIQEFKNIF